MAMIMGHWYRNRQHKRWWQVGLERWCPVDAGVLDWRLGMEAQKELGLGCGGWRV